MGKLGKKEWGRDGEERRKGRRKRGRGEKEGRKRERERKEGRREESTSECLGKHSSLRYSLLGPTPRHTEYPGEFRSQ